jgi:hypothetical protein
MEGGQANTLKGSGRESGNARSPCLPETEFNRASHDGRLVADPIDR